MGKLQKVLIANRGEIALRIARSCREEGIASVALFHPVDKGSPLEAEIDELYELSGDSPVAAFLEVDTIVKACRETGADAVHPGYGFLAESPELARRLKAEGIIFIGPTPEVIDLMGDKIRAREFIISHGFPVVPSVTDEGEGDDFLERVRELGVPLVLKPAAGGGGKGMRIVRDLDELEGQLEAARSEGLRYFGDGRVFCERFIGESRHIEVQVLGDSHGNCVHLWERECSVQRRFQKIVEESPSPSLDRKTREEICSVAVDIAKAVNYTNAGTIEFIMDPDGNFYFLEMNTRLQVEHPVTEMVTGIDLVREQLRVAADEPLEISQKDVACVGHSIECRLYAEDPINDFMPSVGTVRFLKLPTGPGLRLDMGVREGQDITSSFDPMLGKLIVSAASREQAIARLLQAFDNFVLLGVTTNLDFIRNLVNHECFRSGAIHTRYLDKHLDELQVDYQPELTNLALIASATYSAMRLNLPAYAIEPYASMGAWRN